MDLMPEEQAEVGRKVKIDLSSLTPAERDEIQRKVVAYAEMVTNAALKRKGATYRTLHKYCPLCGGNLDGMHLVRKPTAGALGS